MARRNFLELIEKLDPTEVTSGRQIRAFRKYLGLTLKDVEDITGITETSLSAMENDRLEVSKKSAEIIGAALGLHPMDILYPKGFYAKDKRILEIEKKAKRIIQKKSSNGSM